MEQDPDMTFVAIRKVALCWANDIESEAPAATKKQVRVGSQEAVTEGMTNRKRGTSTSNGKSTYEATRKVVSGDGTNIHAS